MKIIATNIKGNSPISDTSIGVKMLHVPSAPVNLMNDENLAIDTMISISWEDGISDGGSVVFEYMVSLSIEGADYEPVAVGLNTKNYL